jgi:hypothetical protein
MYSGPKVQHQDNSALLGNITNIMLLSATLAAVSLAIFLVLPSFRGLIEQNGIKEFSGRAQLVSLFRGFTALAIASILFSVATLLGLTGEHWPSNPILYAQQALSAIGLILSMASIVIVWLTISKSFKMK